MWKLNRLFARIDFFSAWGVSLVAFALYAYQAVKRVQLADRLQSNSIPLFAIFFQVAIIPIFSGMLRFRRALASGRRPDLLTVIEVAFTLLVIFAGILVGLGRLRWALTVFLIVMSSTLLLWEMLRRFDIIPSFKIPIAWWPWTRSSLPKS